jgi:hypothetical protein
MHALVGFNNAHARAARLGALIELRQMNVRVAAYKFVVDAVTIEGSVDCVREGGQPKRCSDTH